MMGRTIIQPIGPLYGEAVNGTVFGRPNGSIFVPVANTISLLIPDGTKIYNYSSYIRSSVDISIIATSQDTSNYIAMSIYEDADCTDLVTNRDDFPAGRYNVIFHNVGRGSGVTIVEDQSYYIRAVLMSGSGVPVAYSEVIEVVGR